MKKVFIILITVVCCVIVGAFVVNTLMPNTVEQVVDAVEDQIFNATGMSFDFNGNGNNGESDTAYTGTADDGVINGGAVDGFE